MPPCFGGQIAVQQNVAAVAQQAAQEIHNHIVNIRAAADEILEGLDAHGGHQNDARRCGGPAQFVRGYGEQQAVGQEHGDVQQQLGGHDPGARGIALRDPDKRMQVQVVLGGVEGDVGVEKENGQIQQRGHAQSQQALGQMVKSGTPSVEPGDIDAVGHIRQNTGSRQQGQQG